MQGWHPILLATIRTYTCSISNTDPQESLTFDKLVAHVSSRAYTTAEDFDLDMARFFVKARRCYPEGSQHHGRVLMIQVRPPRVGSESWTERTASVSGKP